MHLGITTTLLHSMVHAVSEYAPMVNGMILEYTLTPIVAHTNALSSLYKHVIKALDSLHETTPYISHFHQDLLVQEVVFLEEPILFLTGSTIVLCDGLRIARHLLCILVLYFTQIHPLSSSPF